MGTADRAVQPEAPTTEQIAYWEGYQQALRDLGQIQHREAEARAASQERPQHSCRQGIEPCAACDEADALVAQERPQPHQHEWTREYAPGYRQASEAGDWRETCSCGVWRTSGD